MGEWWAEPRKVEGAEMREIGEGRRRRSRGDWREKGDERNCRIDLVGGS